MPPISAIPTRAGTSRAKAVPTFVSKKDVQTDTCGVTGAASLILPSLLPSFFLISAPKLESLWMFLPPAPPLPSPASQTSRGK
jgi:hypothetical protein